jgi:uncharacterized protein YndB with AHSA1/START domain
MLPATPEAVFRAWTDPEHLHHWMSPVGTADAEIDLRVGGRFRIVMAGEGREIEHTGEYLDISPPRRLAFTWRSPYTGPGPSVVTIVLTPRDDGTELLLTHEHLPGDEAAAHGQGWGRMLDRLAGRLGSKEGR